MALLHGGSSACYNFSMKYERGKHPNTHTPEVQQRKRRTQIKNGHPWRKKPAGWSAFNENYAA